MESSMKSTRRSLLAGLGILGAHTVIPSFMRNAEGLSLGSTADAHGCPFRLAVINDEITQDFDKACQIASGEFKLHWIELRTMWNKNVTELNTKEIGDARKILEGHKLQVTDIASPLF